MNKERLAVSTYTVCRANGVMRKTSRLLVEGKHRQGQQQARHGGDRGFGGHNGQGFMAVIESIYLVNFL